MTQWLTQQSPVLLAAIITAVVALVALVVQTAVNVQNNAAQRSLDHERFAYDRETDERRWKHERQVEDEAKRRAFDATAAPIRVIVEAIAECVRPVYVHGDIAMESWSHFNDKLRARLERDDAAEMLQNMYVRLWRLHDQSRFSHAFFLRKLSDPQFGNNFPSSRDVYHTMTVWLSEVVFGCADVLDGLGVTEEAARIREQHERALNQA